MELINHPTDIYNKGTTKSSTEAIWSIYHTHLHLSSNINGATGYMILISRFNRFCSSSTKLCISLPGRTEMRKTECQHHNKPQQSSSEIKRCKVCNLYLLASSCLSLTSYSLLGGSFGRLEGSQASGLVLKN